MARYAAEGDGMIDELSGYFDDQERTRGRGRREAGAPRDLRDRRDPYGARHDQDPRHGQGYGGRWERHGDDDRYAAREERDDRGRWEREDRWEQGGRHGQTGEWTRGDLRGDPRTGDLRTGDLRGDQWGGGADPRAGGQGAQEERWEDGGQWADERRDPRQRGERGYRDPREGRVPPQPSRGSGGGGDRPGGPRRKTKKKRGRSGLAAFFVLLLLAGLGGGGFYGYTKVKGYFGTPDYTGAGTGSVQVQVKKDDTATDIADELYAKEVIKSVKAFVGAATANPKSKSIEVGWYALHKHMSAKAALDALLARDSDGALANKVSTKITIPEGMIAQDIYAKLAEVTKLPVQDFIDAAKDPLALGVPDWWYKRQDGKPQQTPLSIEGFLYPATYDFDPGADAKSILSTMVNQFLTVTGDLKFSDVAQGTFHISPYEALIAASMAQVEAMLAADMPGVVRVFYNRVYAGKFHDGCACLQLDSTVNYWLRVTGKEAKDSGSLTYAQLHDKNNPFNTYDFTGMPPSPISNPGKDALSAAITAPASNNVYFLTIDKDGHTAFATSYSQFCNLVRQAKANGVSIGSC
ncbi:MAG TPA: endolytic transglycosylase MltG [Rugosimonospora sp.]|nr:endolytic transglycosylase MltG [Rugosimonospora sp.]